MTRVVESLGVQRLADEAESLSVDEQGSENDLLYLGGLRREMAVGGVDGCRFGAAAVGGI